VYRVSAQFACALPRGSFATNWYAGSVYTKSFGQAYGRFAIRAKFPDADGVHGLQSAIWTYPREMSPNNAFSGTSEIDIAEAYSQWPDLVSPTVHNFLGGSTGRCDVLDFGAKYHTYALEWTPQRATFYYDDVPCFWAGRVGSAEPFLIALTQALGVRGNAATSATPTPATMKVDWVRVW
jgi:beta-glucanase (GH16 family)